MPSRIYYSNGDDQKGDYRRCCSWLGIKEMDQDSTSFLKKEVIAEIEKSTRTLYPGQAADWSKVQRRTDGWYLHIGMTESDWLARYGADIQEAIKKSRNGNLDHLYDSEGVL